MIIFLSKNENAKFLFYTVISACINIVEHRYASIIDPRPGSSCHLICLQHKCTGMAISFTSVTTVVSSGVGGRGELSLAEVQCHLDKEGASDLVIDLIMNATSDRIFQESILLAIAMLEGGNPVIQVSWRRAAGCGMFSTNTSGEGRPVALMGPNGPLHKL